VAANVSDAAMPVSAGPTGSVRLPVVATRSASATESRLPWALTQGRYAAGGPKGRACRQLPGIGRHTHRWSSILEVVSCGAQRPFWPRVRRQLCME